MPTDRMLLEFVLQHRVQVRRIPQGGTTLYRAFRVELGGRQKFLGPGGKNEFEAVMGAWRESNGATEERVQG